MGMAASQARLLCITARIHDVEYQAQSIQNAKLQLAIQEDRAYEEYNAALDATTLTINAIDLNSGSKSTVPATFNNLCSKNRLTSASGDNFAIRNSKGLLLVEQEIDEGYFNFKEKGWDDPYLFAFYMMNDGDIQAVTNIDSDFQDCFNKAEIDYAKAILTDNKTIEGLYNKLVGLVGSEDIYNAKKIYASKDKDAIKEYEDTIAAFKKALYRSNAAEIKNELLINGGEKPLDTEEFDYNSFNYYVSIYKQIEFAGGCASIDEYNGDAANDSDWLQNMVQSGQFTIEVINEDNKTGEVTLATTSPSSDSCLTYTTTSSIDNRALAKAEAEYEHTLKQIDKKDKKFDLDLSKLETERTALTTEYESVKKVIEDNIDRTFGIFS